MKYSEFFKLLESKDRFIDRNTNLTPDQKNEIKKFFAKHPNYENKIDWNKSQSLTYDDFKPILSLEGKSTSAVKRGSGIKGLVEGKDYAELGSGIFNNAEYHVYQPFTYYASRLIASKYVKPEIDAQWCTAWQKSRGYWDRHSFINKETMVYILGEGIPTKKVAITASLNGPQDSDGTTYRNSFTSSLNQKIYYNIWDAKDDVGMNPRMLPDHIEEWCLKSLENLPKVEEMHEEDLKKTEVIKKEEEERRLAAKRPRYNPATHRYDVDANLNENDLLQYVENGKFKIPFGLVSGNFACPPSLTTLENCPTEVAGSFNCQRTMIKSLKGGPGIVWGRYNCSDCSELESLEGAPEEVGGSFFCNNCLNLTSLKGGPKKVAFGCSITWTHIESLEGGPEYVGGGFACDHNSHLKTLKGAPRFGLLSLFICSNNPELESLEGAPEFIDGDFRCSVDESLISLKGAPKKVTGDFSCSGCDSLKTLEGGPTEVGGTFKCCWNRKLNSLNNMPKKVGKVIMHHCGKEFTEEEIKKTCDVDIVRTEESLGDF